MCDIFHLTVAVVAEVLDFGELFNDPLSLPLPLISAPVDYHKTTTHYCDQCNRRDDAEAGQH